MSAASLPSRIRRLPSPESLLRYFRTLAVMHSAGVNLLKALQQLSHDPDPVLSEVCLSIQGQLQEGQALSRSMARCEGVFSPFQLASVSLGEKSGQLDRILLRLAEVEESSMAIRRRIVSALAQPAFTLALAVVGLTLFMPGFVFRAYLQLVDSLSIESDGAFAAILSFMRLTQSPLFWGLAIGLLALLTFVLWVPSQREVFFRSLLLFLRNVPGLGQYFRGVYARGRSWEGLLAGAEAVLMVSPLRSTLGKSLQAAYTARFASALASQLEAGIPALTALQPAVRASGSLLLQLQEKNMTLALERGESLATALEQAEILPGLLVQMVRVGEESGKLSELLFKVAQFFQQEMEERLESSLALLEPLVICLLGVLMGGFAILMIYPLAKVVQSL